MTASSLNPEQAPRGGLSAPQSASTAECGAREGRGAQNAPEGPSRASGGSEAAPTVGHDILRQRQAAVIRALFPRTPEGHLDELLDELGHVRDDAYTRLLSQLHQERARALHNAPLATRDEARLVTEGIATGLQIATAWALTIFEGHEARMRYLAAENGGLSTAARTTPDNAVASGDMADNPLREQYAAVVTAELQSDRGPFGVIPRVTDAVLAVRDREVEHLRADRDLAIAHDRQPYPTAWAYEQACTALHTQRALAATAEQHRDQLAAVLREVLATFHPAFPRPEQLMRFQATVPIEDHQRWRAVLKEAGPGDGPSVAEATADDRAHWADKDAGEGP